MARIDYGKLTETAMKMFEEDENLREFYAFVGRWWGSLDLPYRNSWRHSAEYALHVAILSDFETMRRRLHGEIY